MGTGIFVLGDASISKDDAVIEETPALNGATMLVDINSVALDNVTELTDSNFTDDDSIKFLECVAILSIDVVLRGNILLDIVVSILVVLLGILVERITLFDKIVFTADLYTRRQCCKEIHYCRITSMRELN